MTVVARVSEVILRRISRRETRRAEIARRILLVTPELLAAVFSRSGLLSSRGRRLIRGKVRRLLICSIPPLARGLRKHYQLQGGCQNCGASCNLLFSCPHWNAQSRLCTIYDSRPGVCRMFPITPADLRDRDLVLEHRSCGFRFEAEERSRLPILTRESLEEHTS
jgi:hypothetical protein